MVLCCRTCLYSLVLAFLPSVFATYGQEVVPLHQQIDEAIATAHAGSLSDVADDHDFLRRLYLNFVGRSPSVEEIRTFVSSSEPTKRTAAIDKLLSSAEFDDYFVAVLDVMFMERRTGKRVTQGEWQSFLRKALQDKWPFDQLVQSILTADGTGENRGAAKFLLERNVEPNALTRDVGRIFLGRDLQCSQCHDHPNIVDYEQTEYYGILAFVNRSYLFEEDTKEKKAFVGEKAEGETEFSSVFSPDDSSKKTPQLLGELTLEAEPRLEGEELYVVAPSKKSAGIPKFSRRAQLARLITHPANDNFSKNVVNRFWKHMVGHGLSDPVDFHHSDNPPSHPALLKVLADEFVNSGFDFRALLRQIALSRTYQLSVDFSNETLIADSDIESRIKALQTAVTLLEADAKKENTPKIIEQLKSRREKVASVDQTITNTATKLGELKKQSKTLATAQTELQKEVKTKQSQRTLLQEAAAAAKKVADSFPEDKALAEKHTSYQHRIGPLEKELETIQSKLTEKKSLAEKATKQSMAEKIRLAKLRADRIGLADMVAESRGALLELNARQKQPEAQIVEKQQQLSALVVHQKYLAQLESQKQLAVRSTELTAVVEAMAEERDQLKLAIANVEAKLTIQHDAIINLTQEAKAATEALAKRQAALDTLKEGIEKTRSAAGQLTDLQLEDAVASLDEKHAALNEQLTSDKQLATKKQAELVAAQAVLKQQEAEQAEIDSKLKVIAEREKEMTEAIAARDQAIAETEVAHEQLHQSWERRFAVRALVPLTPEQLAGSTISALELKPRFQREAVAEWQTNNKDMKPEDIDEAKKTAEIAQRLQKRIDQVTSTYVSMFAAPGGSPQDVFSATVDQALFYANDGRVQSWFNSGERSLLKRLESIGNAAELAQELHLAIFSRPPTNEESSEIEAFLAQHKDDRGAALREIAWGLLTSLEFRFNH